MNPTITVSVTVPASVEETWNAWTTPEDITCWNAASADWHCPAARNDLRAGGRFNYRMEAKDGSMGFDFEGEYTEVIEHRKIAYTMGEGRDVVITFESVGDATKVTENFVAESTHPLEAQQAGWQSILDNFRKHVSGLTASPATGG